MTRSYKAPKKRKWKGRTEEQKLRRRTGDPTTVGGLNNRRSQFFKTCTKCGEEKSFEEFHKKTADPQVKANSPGKYKSRCKECTRAPNAKKVDPNFNPDRTGRPKPKKPKQTAAERREVAAAYKRRIRRATRIKALEYMAEKGCEECGERDPRILEFDHIDQSKKVAAISHLMSNGVNWGSEALRVEIRKCRVLCVKCHRLHTHEQMEYYAHDDLQSALREIYRRYDIKT